MASKGKAQRESLDSSIRETCSMLEGRLFQSSKTLTLLNLYQFLSSFQFIYVHNVLIPKCIFNFIIKIIEIHDK